jgi:hypothetical protein
MSGFIGSGLFPAPALFFPCCYILETAWRFGVVLRGVVEVEKQVGFLLHKNSLFRGATPETPASAGSKKGPPAWT